MSRTDKDTPYWVRAEWWEPRHRCWGHRPCDLPDSPSSGNPNTNRRTSWRSCFWWPEWNDSQVRYRKHKREWRRYEFHGPQRAEVRDAARKVIKGDWEAEFPDGRTRHSVLWDLWQ